MEHGGGGETLSWAVYRYISIGNILCRLLVVTLQHIVTVDPTDGRVTAKYPTSLVSCVSWDKNTDQLFRIVFHNGFQLVMLSDDRFQIIKSLVGFSKIRNPQVQDEDSEAFIPTELDCECDFLVHFIDFEKGTRVGEVISLGAHTIQHMDSSSPYRVFRKVPYTKVQKLSFPDDPAYPHPTILLLCLTFCLLFFHSLPCTFFCCATLILARHLVVILYVNEALECAYQVNPNDFIKFITLLQARVHFHYFLTKSNLDKVHVRDVDDPHVDFNSPQTQLKLQQPQQQHQQQQQQQQQQHQQQHQQQQQQQQQQKTPHQNRPQQSQQIQPQQPHSTQPQQHSPQSSQPQPPQPQLPRGRSLSPAKNAEPHPHSQQYKIKKQEEQNQQRGVSSQRQQQQPQASEPLQHSQSSSLRAQPPATHPSTRPPSPLPSPSPPTHSSARPPSPIRAPSPIQPIPPLQSQQPIQPPTFIRQSKPLRLSLDDSLETNLTNTTESLTLSDLKPSKSRQRPASPLPAKRLEADTSTNNNNNGSDLYSSEKDNNQPRPILSRQSSILESQSVVTLMKGSYLLKYTRHGKGKPHKRYFRFNPIATSVSWSESEGSEKSKIAQVSAVLYGGTLKGVKTTEQFALSLVTPKRTLDLAATNLQDFLMWTDGVSSVLANLDQKP